jgi:hypothetical protein
LAQETVMNFFVLHVENFGKIAAGGLELVVLVALAAALGADVLDFFIHSGIILSCMCPQHTTSSGGFPPFSGPLFPLCHLLSPGGVVFWGKLCRPTNLRTGGIHETIPAQNLLYPAGRAAASASLSAAASEALGEDLTAKDTAIHQSTTLSTDVFWSTTYSDLRTENLITYTPNAAVKPMVTYGGTLTACNTVAATAKALESQGYRVVAGINGDFYNTSTGLPVGVVITDGIIRSSDAGYHAIGFREDGTAVLGKPAIKVSADLGYAAADSAGYSTQVVRQLAGVNKARDRHRRHLPVYLRLQLPPHHRQHGGGRGRGLHRGERIPLHRRHGDAADRQDHPGFLRHPH